MRTISSRLKLSRSIFLLGSLSVTILAVFYCYRASVGAVLNIVNDAAPLLGNDEESILSNSMQETNKPIHILVVPGHEPGSGGTEFADRAERDMVVDLANDLTKEFSKDPRFKITVTRNKEGWNPIFSDYYISHASATDNFYQSKMAAMNQSVVDGLVEVVSSTPHNAAAPDVRSRLYGIISWANENAVDLVINVHFNDVSRKQIKSPGKYTGFAVYIPERQYGNAAASISIGNAVLERLAQTSAVSDLPYEQTGLIEDQELIGVGRYNTLIPPGLLIEYGYIYEPQFDNAPVRSAVLHELAFLTAAGIKDHYFGSTTTLTTTYLPAIIEAVDSTTSSSTLNTLHLQAALHAEGFYPPALHTLHECPLSGYFGNCTKAALTQFQRKNSIANEKGIGGTTTQIQLNKKYGI